MQKDILTCLILFIISGATNAQNDMWAQLKSNNPYNEDAEFDLTESLSQHADYLTHAEQKKDTLTQVFGHFYLHDDYLKKNDYEESLKHILQAESLAELSNNKSSMCWILHKKAALYVKMRDFELANRFYRQSVQFAKRSADTLCMAYGYEQLCSTHGQLKNYDSAHIYYSLAEPLLVSHAGDDALSVALVNYGSLLVYQGKSQEAIPKLRRASDLNKSLSNLYRQQQCNNNLAVAYTNVGAFDSAQMLYEKCIEVNTEHEWNELLFYNYHGFCQMFKQTGNYKEALDYYVRFQKIKDTLQNNELKLKIAGLESKFELEHQTRVLEESKASLSYAKINLERTILIFGMVVLVLIFVLSYWVLRSKQLKQTNFLRQEKLESLTSLLITKNRYLAELNNENSDLKRAQKENVKVEADKNLYNQKILTDSDWLAFKASFEESNAGYIHKVEVAHESLSEAELRLFLFLKLRLSSKDIASILGITVESVKKARYRLRKKLALGEDDSLNQYVHAFK